MWKFESPNARVSVQLQLDKAAVLHYKASLNCHDCLEGVLGISTNLADFCSGLTFVGISEATMLCDCYHLPAGKKAIYDNRCMEILIHFVKNLVPLTIHVRAYDNGVAFRYSIPLSGDGITIYKENTTFLLDKVFGKYWLQDWVPTYEGPYNQTEPNIISSGRHFALPVFAGGGKLGPWIMANEAAVLNAGGNYCISHVVWHQDNCFRYEFAPEQLGSPISSSLPFESPWRYFLLVESLGEVVDSTLNFDLNPPSTMTDTEWIKPARALWSWWASDTGAQVFSEIKNYIDFASGMGFEAVVVDAGWDVTWMPALCRYAKEKGILIWIWSALHTIDTQEKAESLLTLWKSWGVDGVKVDVFESDSAQTACQYQMIAEIAGQLRLMLNYHGSAKPMGEGRTWPHLITTEGVMALEYYKWSNMPNAEHNCTLPFIRNAIGPMDYTPVGFANMNRNTTLAHQLALSVVFESGCTHYAASIFQLEPWLGTDFLRLLPPVYSDMRLLEGYPGTHVVMLRWNKDKSVYVVGCICNQKRMLQLSLDFLPEGEFEAHLYKDDRLEETLIREKLYVTQKTVLRIPLGEHGGACLYIAHSIPVREASPLDGYLCGDYTEKTASHFSPLLGSLLASIYEATPHEALLLEGAALVPISESLMPGPATVRLFYAAEDPFTLEISDGYSSVTVNLPKSGSGLVFATNDFIFNFAEFPARLLMRRIQGAVPWVDKIRIINNHPRQGLRLPIETGVLSGGGTLIRNVSGKWLLHGLLPSASIQMNHIMIPKAGDYLVRIVYSAGIRGFAEISANGGTAVAVALAGTAKWSALKSGDILVREVVLPLQQGSNTIRLCAHSAMPPLHELVIFPFP